MNSACAADTNVSRRGEDVLRRLHSLKMEEPCIYYTDPRLTVLRLLIFYCLCAAIVSSLMTTFMGQGDQKQIEEKSRRSAASEAFKIRILGHLSRSIAAANLGALAVKLVFDTLFSASTTRRLQLQGLSFLTWVLQKANPPAALIALAPVYLKGLITLLAQVKPGAAVAAAAAKRVAANNFPDRIEPSTSPPPPVVTDFSGGSLTAVAGLQSAAEK
jgi:hypothetical protein